MLGSAFSQPRFVSIGPIGNTVAGDRIEQLFVELLAECCVVFALERDHWLEGFERLDRSLEADRSRFNAVSGCSLSDNCSDEIVRQDVRPDFFPDKLRCFASQDVHLHRLFERSQIELRVPARTIELREIIPGKFDCVQQRRGDDEGRNTKAWLLDSDSAFPDHEELG